MAIEKENKKLEKGEKLHQLIDDQVPGAWPSIALTFSFTVSRFCCKPFFPTQNRKKTNKISFPILYMDQKPHQKLFHALFAFLLSFYFLKAWETLEHIAFFFTFIRLFICAFYFCFHFIFQSVGNSRTHSLIFSLTFLRLVHLEQRSITTPQELDRSYLFWNI